MSGAKLGVDRLSISFPVGEFEGDVSAWASRSERFPGTPEAAVSLGGRVRVGEGVEAFVGVAEVPASRNRWWGKVECNPSRVLDPEGYSLAPVTELPGVVEVILGAAEGLVEPMCSVGEMNVKRLDLARDFEGVQRTASLLGSLAGVHRPWNRKNALFNDGTRNGAQTLLVGNKSSSVRLYDKHAETCGRAPEGTLRWEAQARSGWLQGLGDIGTLADVSSDSVEALAANRWEWSAMGSQVAGTDEVVERVMRSGLSPAVQQSVLGWMLMVSKGKQPTMGTQKAAKYRRIARDLGVTLEADLFDKGDGFVARLDWESGTEVLCAA